MIYATINNTLNEHCLKYTYLLRLLNKFNSEITVSGVISLTVNMEVPAAPVEGTDAILLFRRIWCSIL
jgi:hypothetical protein